MRAIVLAFLGLAGALAGIAPARATEAPAIVIPGKAGVPVIIDGRDASYCVVEGDWGLARPGHVPQRIVTCPPSGSAANGQYGGYFPAYGSRPGYGRVEIVPPADRPLPKPAESYYREWGTQSDPLPASVDPPANIELNVAPRFDWRRRRFRRTN